MAELVLLIKIDQNDVITKYMAFGFNYPKKLVVPNRSYKLGKNELFLFIDYWHLTKRLNKGFSLQLCMSASLINPSIEFILEFTNIA